MDIPAIAASVTAVLAPALPYLSKLGEKGAEAVGEKLGEGVWEKAKEIWQKLRPKIEAHPAAAAAAQEIVKAPEDPDAHAALRLHLKNILADDAQLASELERLIEAAKPKVTYRADVRGSGAIAQGPGAVAAGEGGIAVGGDVRGNVHVAGRSGTKK
jgi:hypothetical protein